MATSKVTRMSAKRRATLGVKTASIAGKLPKTRNADGSVKERDKTGGKAARDAKAAKPAKAKPAKSAKSTPAKPADKAPDTAKPVEPGKALAPAHYPGSLPPLDAPKKPAPVEAEALEPAQTVELPMPLIHAALAVASKQDVRAYLNSVFVHQLKDKSLRIVSTDGHRLFLASVACESEVAWAQTGAILPREHLERIVKWLGKTAETLPLSFGVGHPAVTVEEPAGIASFAFRPMDAKFPDYQGIVDKAASVFSAEREEMTVTQFGAGYLKSAGAIASILGSTGILPFLANDPLSASVFAFSDCPEALLYIMGQKAREEALPAPSARLFGKAAMQEQLKALDAQIKRTRTNAKTAKHKKFAEQFEAKAIRLQARADSLRSALAVKLTGPAPAAPVVDAGREAAAPRVASQSVH